MAPLTTFSGLLLAYFALLVVVSRWKSAAVPSRAVQLLRAFFPSWKFFDDIGDEPRLYLRAGVGATLGQWEPALPRPPRRWRALVYNADGNLLLACGSLVQQLCDELEATDPAHPERLTATVAYELTRNLVQFRLRERAPAATRYQFKLRLHRLDGSDEDVLVSPEYELTS